MEIFITIILVIFIIGFIARFKQDGTVKDGAEGGAGCLIGAFIVAFIIFILVASVKTCVNPDTGTRRQIEDAYNLYD